MSKQAIVAFGANISGDGIQSNDGPFTYTFQNSPYQHTTMTITGGNNFISIPQLPAPANYLRILPPSSSTVSKWLMQVGDSTGIQISSTNETWIALVSPPFSFVLRANGTENLDLYFY